MVGNPIFQQLYAEDSLQCTVQKETVLQREDEDSGNESQGSSEITISK